MIPAFALIGILVAGQQANPTQGPQLQAPTDPVVTCEAKNPDFSANPIEFDAEGVDLSEWVKRFVDRVRANWFVPYKALTVKGCAIVSFKVARDGRIQDIVLQHPSETGAFNNPATNAIRGVNPTSPLPDDYHGEPISFTFTFFYNNVPAPSPDAQSKPDPAK